jgi:hypothetical protein
MKLTDQEYKKLAELKSMNASLEALRKISRSLHHLAENACNYGLTKRQESRENTLKVKAIAHAIALGFQAYFQGDPRGCALYLVPEGWSKEQANQEYPSGMAIY